MIILFLFVAGILLFIRHLWPQQPTQQDIDIYIKMKEIEFLCKQLNEKQMRELEKKVGIYHE